MFKQQTHTPSTVTFDLADRHTVDRAAEEILKCYGHVDVLINNAGISFRGNILDTGVSVQRDVMETNYFGPMALTQGQSARINSTGPPGSVEAQSCLFFLTNDPYSLILVSAQSQLSCPPWLGDAAATSLPSAAFRARSPFLTDQLVSCLFPLIN